jgi:hypothetical protein
MARWHRLIAALTLTFVAPSPASAALIFRKEYVSPDVVMIHAEGEIAIGDDERLHRFVASMPGGDRLAGITLNSKGGNLWEGTNLAQTVRRSELATIVAEGKYCVSACFLIFAAGSKRLAGSGAFIGVHSASELGRDNAGAQAATTAMARNASTFGVPPAIIGRMVTTRPHEVAWLSLAELRSMGVEIIAAAAPEAPAYQPGGRLITGSAPPAGPAPVSSLLVSPQAPAVVVVAPEVVADPAFQQGLAERGRFETWFNGLYDDTKLGAAWWAENRGRAARDGLSCVPFSPAFSAGCTQAQMRLALPDQRRRAEPNYRIGWNSL